jgi:hypothetical protein
MPLSGKRTSKAEADAALLPTQLASGGSFAGIRAETKCPLSLFIRVCADHRKAPRVDVLSSDYYWHDCERDSIEAVSIQSIASGKTARSSVREEFSDRF